MVELQLLARSWPRIHDGQRGSASMQRALIAGTAYLYLNVTLSFYLFVVVASRLQCWDDPWDDQGCVSHRGLLSGAYAYLRLM